MSPYHHIDMSLLLEAVGGDVHACRQLTLTYVEVAPRMHEEVQLALLEADCSAVAYASHALKGSTALIGAVALSGTLQTLEALARAGDGAALAQAGSGLAQLFEAVLTEVLHSLAAGRGA